MQKHVLGVSGLAFGLLALGLAIIPGIVFGRPPRNPFAKNETAVRVEAAPQTGKGIKVEYKGLSIYFPKLKKKSETDVAAAPTKAPLTAEEIAVSETSQRMKICSVLMVVSALLGIGFSIISRVREMEWVLSAAGVACCCAALTWQYFVAGICIGAAVAVAFLILSKLDFGG